MSNYKDVELLSGRVVADPTANGGTGKSVAVIPHWDLSPEMRSQDPSRRVRNGITTRGLPSAVLQSTCATCTCDLTSQAAHTNDEEDVHTCKWNMVEVDSAEVTAAV